MLIVRPYTKQDSEAITALHQAQALPYPAPDWGKMVVSAVLEDERGIRMAAFLRKTAETYLLLDPAVPARKRERLGELLLLHKEMMAPARRAGLTDVHCWIPPQLGERFGTLLENPVFGWEPAPWPCFHREVK